MHGIVSVGLAGIGLCGVIGRGRWLPVKGSGPVIGGAGCRHVGERGLRGLWGESKFSYGGSAAFRAGGFRQAWGLVYDGDVVQRRGEG